MTSLETTDNSNNIQILLNPKSLENVENMNTSTAKKFLDLIIKKIIFEENKNKSLSNKSLCRFSVSNQKNENDKDLKFLLYDTNNRNCIDSKFFLNKVIQNVLHKVNYNKKPNYKNDIYFSLEFNKNNSKNSTTTTAKKFMDISIKNCTIKLLEKICSKNISIEERIVKENYELKFDNTKCLDSAKKFLNEINKKIINLLNNNIFLEKNNRENKNLKESQLFLDNIFNKINSENLQKKNSLKNFQDKNYEINPSENNDNECSLISKTFLNEKVRKTVKKLENEEIQKEYIKAIAEFNPLEFNEIKAEFDEGKNIQSKPKNSGIMASKSFMFNAISNVNHKIEIEKFENLKMKSYKEKNSLLFSAKFFNDTLKNVKKKQSFINQEENPWDFSASFIFSSIKRISLKIEEKEKKEEEKENNRIILAIQKEIEEEKNKIILAEKKMEEKEEKNKIILSQYNEEEENNIIALAIKKELEEEKNNIILATKIIEEVEKKKIILASKKKEVEEERKNNVILVFENKEEDENNKIILDAKIIEEGEEIKNNLYYKIKEEENIIKLGIKKKEAKILKKEKEIEDVKKSTNLFMEKVMEKTLNRYNIYYQKLLKYTIQIQRNFRGHLFRFIYKLEKMNLDIQKQNEIAAKRSKMRRILSNKNLPITNNIKSK